MSLRSILALTGLLTLSTAQSGDWTLALSKGSYGVTDIGETAFNSLMGAGAVIKRECASCAATHQTMIYVRVTDVPAGLSLYDTFANNWFSTNNVLNQDFYFYGSEADWQADTNRWQFCNYNDPGVGWPRDCGPSGGLGWQWNSWAGRGGQQNVAFYIYTAASSAPVTLMSGAPIWLQRQDTGDYFGACDDGTQSYWTCGGSGLQITNKAKACDASNAWTFEYIPGTGYSTGDCLRSEVPMYASMSYGIFGKTYLNFCGHPPTCSWNGAGAGFGTVNTLANTWYYNTYSGVAAFDSSGAAIAQGECVTSEHTVYLVSYYYHGLNGHYTSIMDECTGVADECQTGAGDSRQKGLFWQSRANVQNPLAFSLANAMDGDPACDAGSAAATQPIYRLYSAAKVDHFYTNDAAERDQFMSNGYQLETAYSDNGQGIYFSTFVAQSADASLPLYRLNSNACSGACTDHLYTTDDNERNGLLGAGWQDEGMIGYCAATQVAGTVPLYRFFRPDAGGDHLYFTTQSEYDATVSFNVYSHNEGIACYVSEVTTGVAAEKEASTKASSSRWTTHHQARAVAHVQAVAGQQLPLPPPDAWQHVQPEEAASDLTAYAWDVAGVALVAVGLLLIAKSCRGRANGEYKAIDSQTELAPLLPAAV